MRIGALIAVLSMAVPALAQVRLDPSRASQRRLIERFEKNWASKPEAELRCSISPSNPRLGFDLRLWTGYQLRLGAPQFASMPRERISSVIRVTPVDPAGEPVYLARQMNLPKIPEVVPKRLEFSTGGGFPIGEGRYEVSLLVSDTRGRECRREWKAKASDGRHDPSSLAPGEVGDSFSIPWEGFGMPAAGGPERRATVLLNAHPVTGRRYLANLSWWDQSILLNVLGSVLARGGYSSAHVIAFDLNHRRKLFDERQFNRRSFAPLAEALGQVDLATVDYSLLGNSTDDWDFVESLVEEATRNGVAGDIIFITPSTRTRGKNGAKNPALWEGLDQAYLFSILPRPIPEGLVVDFARSGRAKVFSIYSPGDLVSAVKKLAGREL